MLMLKRSNFEIKLFATDVSLYKKGRNRFRYFLQFANALLDIYLHLTVLKYLNNVKL